MRELEHAIEYAFIRCPGNTAEEVGAPLIVMGSHGKRTLEDVLLGTTVENVTKRACCPVLVVR